MAVSLRTFTAPCNAFEPAVHPGLGSPHAPSPHALHAAASPLIEPLELMSALTSAIGVPPSGVCVCVCVCVCARPRQ